MTQRAQWRLVAAVYLAAVVLAFSCQTRHQRALPARAPPPAREEDGLVDIGPDAGVRLSIPSKPASWQKPPPCRRGEHALRGACYQRFPKEDMSPPCEPGVYEHEGQCWRAIVRAPKESNSVKE